ncbi:hypothetical protein GJ496_008375 [Pomphorhynchus laevis]|nr:hypothetical protein GJ496_008375 [Pomphorhynchus laevis]
MKNTSVHSVSIGGWVLSRSCSHDNFNSNVDDGTNYAEHKFPRNTIMQPEQDVRIFSFNSKNAVHDPPNSFIMAKGKQWPVGERCLTRLVDLENKEVAVKETIMDDSADSTNKESSHEMNNDQHSQNRKHKQSSGGGSSVASRLFNLFQNN